jgi:membrane-associated phospholipid phosphatase
MESFEYQSEWEDHRKREFYQPIGFAVGIAVILLILKVHSWFDVKSSIIGLVFLVFLLVLLIPFIVLNDKFRRWKCPKCNERFYEQRSFLQKPQTITNCMNCGLPKYYGSSFYKG